MINPREAALSFEAVKIALRQDKSGWALLLSIHPDEVPEELFRSWTGARYQVVLVELADNNQPISRSPQKVIDSPAPKPHDPSVSLAGALCREVAFQIWAGGSDESTTADILRGWLGIQSRKELATNGSARERLDEIAERYREDTGILKDSDPFSFDS